MDGENYLYAKPVLEMVAVATECCKQWEQTEHEETAHFIDTMLQLLPVLYVKTAALGSVPDALGYNSPKVTEADYDYVRGGVARLMADKDDYLDVFVEDFKYSETPILQTVSENIADIYQALRELVEAFREGYEDAMAAALAETVEGFSMQWGQQVLNVMRALHDVKYGL